jgi:crotonobetaine/carnitine-CoA ligase
VPRVAAVARRLRPARGSTDRSLPSDTLAVLYTSGTTGPAKGVLCSHAQLHWWGVHSADVLGVGADDVLCTTLPLFHINALNTFAQASLAGCRVVYEPRFSASAFWPTMRAREATVVYLLGAMVPILLAQPASARSGAPRAHRPRPGRSGERRGGVPRAHRRAAARGLRLDRDQLRHRQRTRPLAPGCMGWLGPASPRASSTPTTSSCRRAKRASSLLRADEPLAFSSGYFGKPEATAPRGATAGSTPATASCATADGCFRFVDRLKDAIRRRGENISSYEVEQVLQGHPAVAAVAVYPVRSELAEDEVMAALVGARARRSIRPSWRASARRGCRTSRSRASSRSSPTCRAPRTARCRSTSCASAA